MNKEGIELKIDDVRHLPEIVAQPRQLQQVFLNVLSNARYALNQKYPDMHDDKVIEIHGEEAVVNNLRFIRISFLDHGTGIPSQMIDKITSPFFTTKPTGRGTGLGLSISHEIIKTHGGNLLIESAESKFTRVIIELPIKGPGEIC